MLQFTWYPPQWLEIWGLFQFRRLHPCSLSHVLKINANTAMFFWVCLKTLTFVCIIPPFQTDVYSKFSETLLTSMNIMQKEKTGTYEWSLACVNNCLVLATARGLFCAIHLASSRAAFRTSWRPPCTTFDTSPSFSASAAENGCAVYANSRARELFPVIFGRCARVPMSAASPISISYA